MKITAKFSCPDIVGHLREGEYEVADGATIRDAMESFFKEDGRELTDGVINNVVFVVNYMPAQWETVLSDGDGLRVLYRFLGG
ncbi:MAG: MoaD/ThiS family protein [Clostridiales Family XIII bacterium]|jgi:molybdopterin converting factor small subunit|nr:MoaD/ThiS family protein [Clostridiales Family XIII bacterium]